MRHARWLADVEAGNGPLDGVAGGERRAAVPTGVSRQAAFSGSLITLRFALPRRAGSGIERSASAKGNLPRETRQRVGLRSTHFVWQWRFQSLEPDLSPCDGSRVYGARLLRGRRGLVTLRNNLEKRHLCLIN